MSYRPAITSALKSEINITRIVSYGVDLYLLDSTSGHVIHATRGSQGYNIDSEFVCGAGNFSGGALDVLVDMAVSYTHLDVYKRQGGCEGRVEGGFVDASIRDVQLHF